MLLQYCFRLDLRKLPEAGDLRRCFFLCLHGSKAEGEQQHDEQVELEHLEIIRERPDAIDSIC